MVNVSLSFYFDVGELQPTRCSINLTQTCRFVLLIHRRESLQKKRYASLKKDEYDDISVKTLIFVNELSYSPV